MIIRRANKDALAQQILTRYTDLKNARTPKEAIWLECVDAYLSQFPSVWGDRAKADKRSARYMGLSFDAVESNHSAIMAMLMPGTSWLGIEPANPGGLEYDDEGADQVKNLILQQQETMGFKGEMSSYIKQLCILGNAPYSLGWRQDLATDYPAYEKAMVAWQIVHKQAWEQYTAEMQRWQTQARAAQQDGSPIPPRPSLVAPEPPPGNSELAYSGPSFESGSIFDYLIDPYSPDPKHPMTFRRSWISKSELDRLSEPNAFGYSMYSDTEDIHSLERKSGLDSSNEIAMMAAFGLQAPPGEAIELIECWGTMVVPKDVGEGSDTFTSFVGTIANRAHVIRFEPTFLWSGKSPHGMGRYRNVPGQVYGIGTLEPVLGLQDLINVRVNQLIDIVSFSINQEFKAVDDGIISTELVSAPNRIHWVGNMDNLQPIPKDLGALNAAMTDLEYLKAEFQRMTKSLAPAAGRGDESATKTRQQGAATSGDLGKIAAFIEDDSLSPIIDVMIELNAQYLPEGTAVRALEDGQPVIKQVSPEALRKGWFSRVTGTRSVLDQQERLDKLMMFFQLVMGSPISGAAVNQLEFMKKIYEELGFGDAGTIFNDEARANEILGEMIRSGMLGANTGMDLG